MKRELNFDVLRAVSCISVVVLHIAALYTDYPAVYELYSRAAFSFCDFLQIITRTAVPCFVMLSGAFLLEKDTLDVRQFYRSSATKFGIPTAIFSGVYILFRIVAGDSLGAILLDTLKGQPLGHMWYMFMLVGLYAFYPFVFYFCKEADERMLDCTIIIVVCLSCIVHFTCQLIWPIQFIEYLGYFLAGHWIKKNRNRIFGEAKIFFAVAAVFLTITFFANELSFSRGCFNPRLYRNPNFPTVIVASFCMFTAFSKVKMNKAPKAILQIAKHSMFIYLVHPLIYGAINKCVKVLAGQLPHPGLYVPCLFTACFACSLLAAELSSKLSKIINKKIIKC